MNLDAAPSSDKRFDKLTRHRAIWLTILTCLTFAGITLALLSRSMIGGTVALNVGDVASRDIRAPHQATYVSDIETKRLRDLAEASVAPIFTPPDAQISRRQLTTARDLLDHINQIRADANKEDVERIMRLTALTELAITDRTARQILSFNEVDWARIDSHFIVVLDSALRSPIHPDGLNKARSNIAPLISLSLRPDEADIVNQLASAMLVPNTNYDSAATDAARRSAREGVGPVERTFEPNQVIIRSGQVVGPADIEALDKLGLRRPTLTPMVVTSALLYSLLAVSILALSMLHSRDNAFVRPIRQTALSAALFVFVLLLARWLLPGHGVLPYLAPLASVSLAITSWSGTLPGVVSAMLMGSLVGPAMDNPLEFAICIAASGVTACLVLGRVERLDNFIKAGAAAGLVQCLVVLAFNLPALQTGEAPLLITYLIASLASGLLSAGLALAILHLSSLLFGITTIVQLIELSRLSHPLLQRMILKAPGTYHHSLMVANLAEQAAERVDADPLLTRVGAYFHDIGKIANPQYFIENQLDGSNNPHDQLDPRTSSSILQNHVTDGLKLASKHRLPSRVRAFIAEHHGTTKTNHQYAQACQEQDGPVDDSPFRYPGPRPQSKETALVMLADGCEAAVRACRCSSLEEMDEVIRRVIGDRLADHQLDDSDLTLREMDVVRQSFLDTLRGMYHPRVQYAQIPGPLRDATEVVDNVPRTGRPDLPGVTGMPGIATKG